MTKHFSSLWIKTIDLLSFIYNTEGKRLSSACKGQDERDGRDDHKSERKSGSTRTFQKSISHETRKILRYCTIKSVTIYYISHFWDWHFVHQFICSCTNFFSIPFTTATRSTLATGSEFFLPSNSVCKMLYS